MDQDLPIAVIGAGFSGTMTALHLLKRVATSRVILCERGRTFGRGVAYSTCSPCHLLNVRSTNMSAFADKPDHFAEWLASVMAAPDADLRCHVRETDAGTFVSRDLYGRYLTSLLSGAICDGDGAQRLTLVGDEVVDLEPCAGGYRLALAGGRSIAVSHAVLATGNLLPDASQDSTYITNPWSCGFTDGLEADRPVVILGTGLTMVDIATQLRATGFSGPVIAISRRGLQPRSHAATTPWPTPILSQPERFSVHALLHRIRREVAEAAVQGVAWQSVIDSLRPLTAPLWQDLPAREQARFLRHLRPWWDVHRHRAAPPIAQEIAGLLAKGWLRIQAGRILGVEATSQTAIVRYRPRGQADIIELEAQRVIDATGIAAPTQCSDQLLRRILERHLIRPDRHHLGLDVTPDLRAIGVAGTASRGLWALGPMARGVFWECTAVPDIRRQAMELAGHIADDLAEDHPSADDLRAA
jgi:uncharacterized NAD(P)/FAD-binding protein YdhS